MDSPSGPEPAAEHGTAESVRHQIMRVVSEVKSDDRIDENAEMRLYLALLQDRLPVYVSAMSDLSRQVGQGDVVENLMAAVGATIDYYRQILAPKIAVFTQPAQLSRLRQLLREMGMSPERATERIVHYLTAEQELGRVAADVDPLAASRLLQGAAVNYAFNLLLFGERTTERTAYIRNIVTGARLPT